MFINNIVLSYFRNFKQTKFEFGNRLNLIIGKNGAGKTSIIEAINLLSTGKSFKARYDHEMIYNPGILNQTKEIVDVFDGSLTTKDFAKAVGTILTDADEETLEVTIVRDNLNTKFSQKTYKVNGTPKRIYESTNIFNCVLFTPQDLELFTGSPALRRRFLDDLLYKVDQKYKKEHMLYTKAVRQRNKVLEKIHKTSLGQKELPFWTEKILESGTYMQQKRSELIEAINSTIGGIYSDVSSQNTNVQIDYKINELTPERLEKHQDHEIFAKTTLVGPHRDDFDFLVNTFNIAHYGSRGQQRTGVLALKMCELDIVKQKINNLPVLLLDDIFSELDDSHKRALEQVVQKQQTIITSTHPDIITQNTIVL